MLTRRSFLAGGAVALVTSRGADAGAALLRGTDATSFLTQYDVILLAGQSNASGYGHFKTGVIDPTDPRILQLPDGSGGPLILATDPLDNPDLNAQPAQGLDRIGFATAFCRAFVATLPATTGVIIVPAAYEGSNLVGSSWDSASPGALYENALTQANRAMAMGGASFAGVLWHQGEGDTLGGVAPSVYSAALDALIAGFRSHITGASGSWFVLGGMVPEWVATQGTQGANMQAVLADTPNRNARCAYWTGATGEQDSANGFDSIHYSAAGQLLNGAAAFAAGRAAMLF